MTPPGSFAQLLPNGEKYIYTCRSCFKNRSFETAFIKKGVMPIGEKMSDTSENPYESPQAEISSVKPLTTQGVLTETMVLYLKGASPWMRFVGIAGFIILGLYALVGLTMVAGIRSAAIPGLYGGMGILAGLVFLGAIALMFFPVLFVFRFGQKIKSYLHTGNEGDLEQAFKNNKSLWKFTGILSIISLGIAAITVLVGGIAAIISAAVSGF
jgi:hypothetical protein